MVRVTKDDRTYCYDILSAEYYAEDKMVYDYKELSKTNLWILLFLSVKYGGAVMTPFEGMEFP